MVVFKRKVYTVIVPFPSVTCAAIVLTSAEMYVAVLSLPLSFSLSSGVTAQCLSDCSDILMF